MSTNKSGGAKTKTGAKFEFRIWEKLKEQISKSLVNVVFDEGSGLNFISSTSLKIAEKRGLVIIDGQPAGFLCAQDDLYNFLAENYPDKASSAKEAKKRKSKIKAILSKNLNPDLAYVNLNTKRLTIVEIKAQNGDGSVDEKLETVDFKRKQYAKLIEHTDLVSIEFKWILDRRFEHAKYADVKRYIKEMKSDFLIDEVSPEFVGIL